MALIELLARPKVVGQYPDARLAYDPELPIRGAVVQQIEFGVMDEADIEARYLLHKSKFDASQASASLHPVGWQAVGYYIAPGGAVTVYYQLVKADHTDPVVPVDEPDPYP